MTQRIEQFIDFFYPPFSRFMNRMTFRYAACGGANTVLDIFLFFLSYNFVFQKQIVRFSYISISPYIAAFMLSFCITFPIGFLLNRYVVFQGSVIAGRIQLFRYGVTVVVSILLNYLFLKLFIEGLGLFPTVAKILTTFIVVGFSYLSQSYFTFKVKSYRS